MTRSESNLVKLNGTGTYPDLNMTHFPDKIDTRVAGAGYNPNLKGFENRKDYNLAEHVNALGDAVMAVERSMGITPYMDKNGVNRGTVSARIRTLEEVDLDPRYGGVGWNPSQTLVSHTHTGTPGGPSKISLTQEVTGKLPKDNLNLVYNNASGLTGSDIAVSKEQSTTIAASINDKLSTSQGGVIQKSLQVKGRINSRFYADIDVTQVLPGSGTLIVDSSTRSGQAVRFSNGADAYRGLVYNDVDLQYGKYIASIRMKTTNNTKNEALVHFEAYNQTGLPTVWTLRNYKTIKSTDFLAANQWQTFYFVFDHVSDRPDGFLHFIMTRMKTATNYDLLFDYIHICPAHPAIYDN